jgi:anthranilate/para-aminobenzoate synthase component II
MILMRNKLYRLLIIGIILGSFTPISLISKSVQGATVASQMVLSDGKTSARGVGEEKVRRMLENKIVAERLKSYGLSKEEVTAKVDKMSDEQIHQLAALSDRIPAGGDGAATAAVIVLVVFVIVILLLVILRKI